MIAQLIRFVGVGGLATATHVAVATVLLSTRLVETEYLANLGGFVVAVWVSYHGHRRVTFGRAGSPWRLLVVALAGFALNNSVLVGLVESGIMGGWVAVALSTAVVPLAIFVALKLWVFRARLEADRV